MNSSILTSWAANAQEWIRLISENTIPSRSYTNKAILAALDTYAGPRVLDMGCGEGWLARTLHDHGKQVTGIDGTEALIAHARKSGKGSYAVMGYGDIVQGADLPESPFDTVVFNFSLYDRNGMAPLWRRLAQQTTPGAHMLIQTLHPLSLLAKGLPYQDQEMANAWEGLPGAFSRPHAWDALTFEGWTTEFEKTPWRIKKILEPTGNAAPAPLSVIFVLSKSDVSL